MEIIKAEKLTRYYGTGEALVKAVDGVDLSIKKGEFVSVIGPSGCGKSTLLHLLGCVDKPTSGNVIIDGEKADGKNDSAQAVLRRRKIGFIFQYYNLIPVLTVEENITLPLMLDKTVPDKDYLHELLRILGLDERRHHLPSQLSGGQQQRTAIGRALIYRPSIILADEPTGNLDSRNSRDVMDLIRLSASSFGQTVMLVTHDSEIASGADRVITFGDGRIVNDSSIAGCFE